MRRLFRSSRPLRVLKTISRKLRFAGAILLTAGLLTSCSDGKVGDAVGTLTIHNSGGKLLLTVRQERPVLTEDSDGVLKTTSLSDLVGPENRFCSNVCDGTGLADSDERLRVNRKVVKLTTKATRTSMAARLGSGNFGKVLYDSTIRGSAGKFCDCKGRAQRAIERDKHPANKN